MEDIEAMLVSLRRLALVESSYQKLLGLPVEGVVKELDGPRAFHHRELAILLANDPWLPLGILVTDEGRYRCLNSPYSNSDEQHGDSQPRDACAVV